MLANILVIVLMLLVGYSDHIDPREHAVLSTLGLSLPLFIALNVAFLLFWLIFNRRYVLVPLVGFIVCWGPVRRYCPVNVPKDTPKGAIKVLSYNVWLFDTWEQEKGEMNPIVDYLLNSGADIICLQEAGCDPSIVIPYTPCWQMHTSIATQSGKEGLLTTSLPSTLSSRF